jgi:LPXTG-motif cell wall-anchored protein
MNASNKSHRVWLVLAVGAVALVLTLSTSAQVQTQTTVTSGQPTTEVKVNRATVVLVDGNDLVVKTEGGKLVHFANVPESARATVGGQQLGIHDLKPGMTLERTITTVTTPQTITTVSRVTGTVWEVNPPTSVILTLEDGTNQQFKIPEGQKFNIDGQMVDAWGLKKGMKVTATKIVERPETLVEQQRQISGTMAPPAPPVDVPILVLIVPVEVAPADTVPASIPAEAAPTALPKTGSELPLFGILGFLALVSGLGLRVARQRA